MSSTLFTIGYEKARLADFLATLAGAGIATADRRARPADLAPSRLFEAATRSGNRGSRDALSVVCGRSVRRPRAARPQDDAIGTGSGALSRPGWPDRKPSWRCTRQRRPRTRSQAVCCATRPTGAAAIAAASPNCSSSGTVSRCITWRWPRAWAERRGPWISLRREPASADTQFGDTRLRVKVGPVRQREIGDLAGVVGPVGEVEFLAADTDGAQTSAILQQPDIGERRAVPHDEVGGATRFENADFVANAHEAGVDFGRGAQRGGRAEPEIGDEQFEFLGVPLAIRRHREAGVGTGQERDAGCDGLFQIGDTDPVARLGRLDAALLSRRLVRLREVDDVAGCVNVGHSMLPLCFIAATHSSSRSNP